MPDARTFLEIVAGILLLFGGGELVVAGAVAISLLLRLPQVVIGLTVVAFGTSAPELFVSLLSTLQGSSGGDSIAVSNVLGSNIFNVMVVLGASAAITSLRVRSRLLRRDVPLLLAVSMATWAMASSGRFTWVSGLALLTALGITLVWEFRSARSEQEDAFDDIDTDEASTTPVAIFKLASGLALLVLGSQILIRGAVAAALNLGVSEAVIGLTIVSAGTSMPELVTSVVAAYKGKADLAIGNVVGSNLLNQLLILGLCSLLSGQDGLLVSPELVSRDFPVMVLTTLACLPIFFSQGVINRTEGWLLLGAYGLYLVEQILSSTAAPGIDEFRLFVLVAALPLVLVFLTWTSLRWMQQRRSAG